MREELRQVFEGKDWSQGRPNTSISGFNAGLRPTKRIRAALPKLFAKYNVSTFHDVSCGDWFWMQHVDLSAVHYTGWEIAQHLVDLLQPFVTDNVSFALGDITSDPLPKSDMVMCRDTLVLLKNDKRWDFLENFAASGSTYLLASHWFVDRNRYVYHNGGQKPISMLAEPFSFGEPVEWVLETSRKMPDNQSAWAEQQTMDRAMGLWHRDQVVARLNSGQDRMIDPPAKG